MQELRTSLGVSTQFLLASNYCSVCIVLFDLFDLNEGSTLSTMDLEFAIQCVVMSTSKIFNIGAECDEKELTTLVRQSFNQGVRITLAQVLKWSSVS